MRSVTMKEGGAVGLALAAMIAASACGGRVLGTGETAERTPTTTPDDPTPITPYPTATSTAYPPPTTTSYPPPPPSFDPSVCGEGGGRMRADDFCGSALRQVPCDFEYDAAEAGPYDQLPRALCQKYCLYDPNECANTSSSNPNRCSNLYCNILSVSGGRQLNCYDACPGGRRPEGYGGERADAATSLGRAFARLAQLESVSIPAFGRLAGELDRLGFARDLVRRARDAKTDEVRHARATWKLARRFGAQTSRLERMPVAHERSLLELAIENIEEGCVREAYGAVVAAHQAARAADPEVRRVMTDIARDEAAHAELAWAIHEEAMTKLDDDERTAVMAAFDRACRTLEAEIARAETDETLRATAGLPDRAAALAGLRVLSEEQRRRV